MNERDLLVAYSEAKKRRDDVKDALKDCQAVFDKAEAALIEHLVNTEATATATYDGIGYANMQKPRIYASFLKEDEDEVKKILIEKGREDLIKETISAPSLSAFVGELIENGKPIPEKISYYLKTSLRLY